MWEPFTSNEPGASRPAWVYTPQSYQPGIAVPLLVLLHGCRQTPEDFAAGTGMNALAEQHQFIVVYPRQPSQHNHTRCWNWFLPEHQARGQGEPASIVGIVRGIVASTARWTIDPARISVAGMSAGGAMAAILGATYPDVFAAIGIHSGMAYRAATSIHAGLRAMQQGGSNPVELGNAAYAAMGARARVVPTLVFQGMADAIVAPINGEQVVQQWMQTNQLASRGRYTPDHTQADRVMRGQAPRGRSYSVQVWHDAEGNDVQAYWQVEGMGHAWSGGSYSGSYSDPKGPDASLVLYHFFQAHPMPRPVPTAPAQLPALTSAAQDKPAPSPLWASLLRATGRLWRRLRQRQRPWRG